MGGRGHTWKSHWCCALIALKTKVDRTRVKQTGLFSVAVRRELFTVGGWGGETGKKKYIFKGCEHSSFNENKKASLEGKKVSI